MGTCKYCNLSAGFLKSAHRECEQKYLSGMHQMKTIAANDLVNSNEWDTLENRLTEIAKINNIPLHHMSIGFEN
jgi:hypothetical protein